MEVDTSCAYRVYNKPHRPLDVAAKRIYNSPQWDPGSFLPIQITVGVNNIHHYSRINRNAYRI